MLYKLRILLLLIVFTSSCGQSNVISPTPTLFLVDATGRLEYRFMLFDLESKKLNIQNVDFSITNWDVTLGSSRFSTHNGSESVHYNPLTKEIIFVLLPGAEGIGGWKPADALPAPPFKFAIYKTSSESQNQFTLLYSETSFIFFINHTILNPQTNSLIMDVSPYKETYSEVRNPEILKFDIKTGQLEYITNTETELAEKKLKEGSDLRLSSNGQKLYQLVLYGDLRKWTNETLYLKTVSLNDQSVSYQEIVTGGSIDYNILALSDDGSKVAFYTLDAEQYVVSLWVKDLENGNTISVPLPESIGNYNLYMSSDGNKILVGFQERTLENIRRYWKIYDLNSNEYQSTPINRFLAWDSSGRYIAGIKDNSYIIYDTKTLSETTIEIFEPTDDFHIQSAQWR